MTAVLELLPIVIAAALAIGVAVTAVRLLRRPLRPAQLLVSVAGAGSSLAVIGIASLVPSRFWWVPWLLILALLVGIVVCCIRTLRTQESLPRRPGILRLLAELIVWAALLALAVIAAV